MRSAPPPIVVVTALTFAAACGVALAATACAGPRAAGSATASSEALASSKAAAEPSYGGKAVPVAWRKWDGDTFAAARTGKKIVVVTIATEWCHWCHVMDEKTWADPEVQALVDARFVAVREDADARPDLAERYADWGWPALALLSPDGEPITELRGYQDKSTFLPLLRSLIARLDKGEKLSRASAVSSQAVEHSPLDAITSFTRAQLDSAYDDKQGGWGRPQKYPLYAPVEELLLRASLTGDAAALERALTTADNERQLIDPTDGGMFQYSLDAVWSAPHYEKLAEINGNALGTFALAYEAAKAAGDARAASFAQAGRLIQKYVTTSLRDPSGAFYANQDADVGTRGDRPLLLGKQYYALDAAGRAKAGAPFVDKHIYAAHNGRIIAGLARFGAAVGDKAIVEDAARAFDVVSATHASTTMVGYVQLDGPDTHVGYLHSPGDTLEHLADDVAMGQAALELYDATGEMRYRERARTIAKVLLGFADDDGALLEHAKNPAVFDLDARKPIRANAEAARFLLKIGRLDDDASMKAAATKIVEHFSSEAVIKEEGRMVGEYLLALDEVKAEPLHFAVVTAKDDEQSASLYRAALEVYTPHRLIEIVRPGAKFPDLGKPALYLCGSSFCSPPMTDPKVVPVKSKPFLKPRT